MAIANFKEQYTDRYQDTFHKVLVSRKIANYRLESNLKQGDKVHRFAVNMSAVQVRTITALTDRTIDAITNSDESLTIDQYKGVTFPVSNWEDTLHGNPDLGMLYGKEAAILVAEHTDATILNQVTNATYDFDTGDLTTLTSTGVPVDTVTSTNIPLLITRAKAKLANNNQVRGGNMVWVVDDYTLANFSQHVIGRDTNLGDTYFQNGQSGSILGSEIYTSDNLTAEVVLGIATNPTATDTIVISGITFTFVASPTVAGDVDLGSDAEESNLHLSYAINGTGTAGTDYIEVSTANRAILTSKRITATAAAATTTLVGIGAGRLVVSETFTDATDTVDSNSVHCYFGKKGAIDVVMAKEVKMKLREEPKQDTVNIFNDHMYGVKTFADGKLQMLDVLVDATK